MIDIIDDQVPSSDVEASVHVAREECSVENNKVRYHHHSIVTDDNDDASDEGVKNRKKADHTDDETVTPVKKSRDPLRWFGILSPPALKQSQTSFKSSVELCIDIANIQSEISGVINRVKFIKRLISKNKHETADDTENTCDNDVIEELDSSFQTSVKI